MPSPTLLIGRAADAEILLRGIESGAVKRIWPVGLLSPSNADRGQIIRNIPVLGGIDDIEDVIGDFARRNKPIARVVMTPSAFEPEAKPESILMRARRLGLIVSRLPSLESGDAPRLTTVAVEDLLLRPSANIDYARLEALVRNNALESWRQIGLGAVGNRSRRPGKGIKPIAAVFTTLACPSCLPGRTGAKLASHIKGRVRNVAGDRGGRFYRIERRGRVE